MLTRQYPLPPTSPLSRPPLQLPHFLAHANIGEDAIQQQACAAKQVGAAAIIGFGEEIAAAGGKVIALNVSCANHSPLLAGAVPEFAETLAGVTFNKPNTPVYLNATAATENDPEAIRAIMGRQMVSMVRWQESITAILAAGVDTFIEVGPKTVLQAMMKKLIPKNENGENGKKVTALQVDSPETLAACQKMLA
jgi:[acyl-carrier-protein] S-malonyltransferase